MRKATVFVALALLFVLCAVPTYANGIPALPHAFYGSVTINGAPAPAGTSVEARGEGVLTGIQDNPVITSAAGIYGTSNPFQHRLLVQGDIEDGATLTFYVNGISTGQTAAWHSGNTTQLDLALTIPGPPVPETVSVSVTFFGTTTSFVVDSSGIVQDTVVLVSPDGSLTVTIPKGTKALDKNGKPLAALTAGVMATPPAPPKDTAIIGLAYDFGPDGATFDPPIVLTWAYDEDALPEGVAEEDLVLAYWDSTAGAWVELPSVVDVVNNIVTGQVAGFCCFGLLGTVTPPVKEVVAPPKVEVVTPPEVEEEEEEEVAPPEKEKVEPVEEVAPPEKEEVPEEVAKGVNWFIVGGSIAGAILVGWLVYEFYRRRAYN